MLIKTSWSSYSNLSSYTLLQLQFGVVYSVEVLFDLWYHAQAKKNTLKHHYTTLKDRKQMWLNDTNFLIQNYIKITTYQIKTLFNFNLNIICFRVYCFTIQLLALDEWQFRNICQNGKTELVYFMHIFLRCLSLLRYVIIFFINALIG